MNGIQQIRNKEIIWILEDDAKEMIQVPTQKDKISNSTAGP